MYSLAPYSINLRGFIHCQERCVECYSIVADPNLPISPSDFMNLGGFFFFGQIWGWLASRQMPLSSYLLPISCSFSECVNGIRSAGVWGLQASSAGKFRRVKAWHLPGVDNIYLFAKCLHSIRSLHPPFSTQHVNHWGSSPTL